jgi:phage tail sheath protein FI
MGQIKFGSAGVTTREVDLSGPTQAAPVGVPAGVIGTAVKGPAFVPVTVGLVSDFYAKFGRTDGKKFAPLAAVEWLRNAQSLTFLRVLGVGTGEKRTTSGTTAGKVAGAGFVVGEQQPNDAGILASNPYANAGGSLGRTYFLGCFMSESLGSTVFSAAGLQGANSVTPGATTSLPIIRGMLMAPSGVILRLSSSYAGSNGAPGATQPGTDAVASGSHVGSVILLENSQAKQQFTMLLNGHKGTDPKYPNVLTASFDMTSPNYFANVFNTDPFKIQQAGHYLYSFWDIHPSLAVVTGTGLVSGALGANGSGARKAGTEAAAFLTTGSLGRDVGSATVPDFENFEDRYRHGVTPWIVSQKFGGQPQNLFRIHALDDGSGVSEQVKISIENISPATNAADLYGTFDVVVRDWADTDQQPRIYETFRGASLDPSSDRFIGKLVGDQNIFFDFDKVTASQKLVIEGNYPNRSNYIRVELDSSVDTGESDPVALPMGFRGPAHLVTSGSAPLTHRDSNAELTVDNVLKRAVQVPVPYRQSVADGSGDKKLANSLLYWGVQFEQVTSVDTPNGTNVKSEAVKSFATYMPDFMTAAQNVVETDAWGAAATDANGILDSDRFNYNRFSLENVQVVTGSDTLADVQKWEQASYVRSGLITANDANKTRALSVNDLVTPANRRFAKFTTFMQGGFDGTNLFDRNESALNDVAAKGDMDDINRGLTNGATVKAYMKAIEVVKNKSDVDIKLLAIPGIRQSVVTDTAVAAVEERFDALYIMDIVEYDTVNSVLTGSLQSPSVTNTTTNFKDRALNTSFAAAYYPDVVMEDPNTGTNVVVPPSVAVLGAFALNDRIAHPWFAPAGFSRGALATTKEAKVRLSKDNMDTLYDANINPLVAFPGTTPPGTQAQGGVVVWGQRTLYQLASSLDRVNVRRLLIEVRRQVRDVGNTILFEPNRESTLAAFAAAVEPKLAKIRKQFGVQAYKVQIDASTTTQIDIENNTIRGKIFVVPTRSIEFVQLDFVITNRASEG